MTLSEPASHVRAMHLADLADAARRLGRTEQADRFVMLAWAAYDEPDPVNHRDAGISGIEHVVAAAHGIPRLVFASVQDAPKGSSAEAHALRLRTELMGAVQEAVAGWTLTQAVAARRLGATLPRLQGLLHGRTGEFSLDALTLLATRAGLNVRVEIESAAA